MKVRWLVLGLVGLGAVGCVNSREWGKLIAVKAEFSNPSQWECSAVVRKPMHGGVTDCEPCFHRSAEPQLVTVKGQMLPIEAGRNVYTCENGSVVIDGLAHAR